MIVTHPAAVAVSCIKQWLKGTEFRRCHVATKVPEGLDGSMVRVDYAPPVRETTVTDRTRLMLQAYAGSDQECLELLSEALDGMDNAYLHHPTVLDWQTDEAPYEFPDPDREDTFRWQAAGTLWTTIE